MMGCPKHSLEYNLWDRLGRQTQSFWSFQSAELRITVNILIIYQPFVGEGGANNFILQRFCSSSPTALTLVTPLEK